MQRAITHTGLARTALACGLMVASGFAGLAYQIVWTQQGALWLGHEAAAVLAVVAAFFGGLAAGALLFSSRIERASRPARWYAAFELIIGLWSLVLVLSTQPGSSALLALIGPQPSALWHWSVAFCGTFLLILPATLAMGATLPAMERTLAATHAGKSTIGTLYAANTFGALLGVLGAAFWLVPRFGLLRTAAICATLNLACALIAWRLPIHERRANGSVLSPIPDPLSPSLILAVTGMLGIGYEVLVVRALSQVTENTVYTFAILLAVYLVGTTLGAAAYARWLVRSPNWERLRDRLLQALALACLTGTFILLEAPQIHSWSMTKVGSNVAGALVTEVVLATAAFLLPTMLMGALFSHLSTSARAAKMSFGRAIGFNTLGAAVAPMLFGVVLMPWLGLKAVLLLIALGYLALSRARAWREPAQWIVVAATVASMAWAPSLVTVGIPDGGKLVHHVEGVTASVAVVESADGVATLHINNRQQEGSSATLFADARQALLPIVLHSEPRRALFLGVGTGLTASAATLDPAVQVDAVELVPEVIAASTHFSSAMSSAADEDRLHLFAADARRFVRTAAVHYDVIISDNFHPARSGSGSLYTVEHFALVKQRLAPGGLFCQWLPLHQMDLDTFRSIARSFLTVYPHGSALLATNSLDTPVVGLIARRDGEPFELDQIRERVHRSALSARLKEFDIDDEFALLGSFIAGAEALAEFSANSPLNTDDHPVVAYRAPAIAYAPDSLPRDRLIALLSALRIAPRDVLASADVAKRDAFARLSAYWDARDRFIEAGRNVQPSADVRQILAQVREPLLSVLHVSPDFRPAYDPLLRMATALGRFDRDAARVLLTELQEVQPGRPEATRALHELEISPP